jgi:hypothetical protein
MRYLIGFIFALLATVAQAQPAPGPEAMPSYASLWGAYLSNAGAPTSGGTGYAALDTITCASGVFTTPCTIVVDTVTAGVITGYHVTFQGAYTAPPATVTQGSTSGGGSGAMFTLNFGPLAADVSYPTGAPGNPPIPNETFLGYHAGFGRTYQGLGNLGLGNSSCGGGGNTADLMGGGTGLTVGENTCVGWYAGTQLTTNNGWFTVEGVNSFGHESTGSYGTGFGTDTCKWCVNSNELALFGRNAGKFLINPSYVTAGGSGSLSGGSYLATVSGAANNGSGKVRLTLNSTTGMLTGDSMQVLNVTGTTEANGFWSSITVIDATHVDISPSFVHAYVSGGSVQDFPSTQLAHATAWGFNNISNVALRSVGRLGAFGDSNLTSLTTGTDDYTVGNNGFANLTTGSQNLGAGGVVGGTCITCAGVVLVGYQTDVAANGATNAVAVGGAANGGGQGAVASDGGTTIGAKSGAIGMGTNAQIFGPQQGTDCVSTNNNFLLIGVGANTAGCGASTSFTRFAMIAWEATKLVPTASHTFSLGGIITMTGTDTVSTSVTKMGGQIVMASYTVATLPTGTQGARVYVTDATTCVFGTTPTGSGSTKCPVFYNGSAWVGG